MRPPVGVIIITQPLAAPSPVRPRRLDGNAGENGGDKCRDHEEEAVDDCADAYLPEEMAWEDAHEEEEDRDFGEDDGGDVGDLRDPGVLGVSEQ